MDEPKLWREILFLMIPLLVMVSLTFILGCSRSDASVQRQDPTESHRRAVEDPYAELHVCPQGQRPPCPEMQ